MRLAVALGVALVMTAGPWLVTAQRPQVPGALRSRIVVVPVDVRVIDRDGHPVTGLSAADFTVLEDGVPQEIGHFSEQALTPLPSPPGADTLRLVRNPGLEASPQPRRVFLIVLGRGRLQHPGKGLDAVRKFLRSRALPQDLVAVQAYGRTTDFLTDRDPLVRFLDHYEAEHERLEALLNHWFQGRWSFDSEASPGVERKIEDFFRQPGLPPMRRLALLELNSASSFEERLRASREANVFTQSGATHSRDFVYDPAGASDAAQLYTAIEYLRYFEGEKHVLYLSEFGLWGSRGMDQELMSARASDARVAVSVIRTGGVETSFRGNIFEGPPSSTFFANRDARDLAKNTGGLASAYTYAWQTLDRLDRATRHSYLLGYYPANTDWNGNQRRIEVRVKRPGVRVLHRGSYLGRDELIPFDRRAFLAHARITGAAGYRVQVRDIRVTVDGKRSRGKDGIWRVDATVSFDATSIAFEQQDGRHAASIDVGLFLGDRRERSVGELRQRVDLRLEPSSYRRAQHEPLTFAATIVASAEPRHLKAVAYDSTADRLGSSVITLETKKD